MIPKNKARTRQIPFFMFLLFASSHLIAKSFSVGLFGNFDFPQTPKSFRDSYTTGIGLGGELKYHLSNRTALRLNARYQSQEIKTEEDIIINALVGNPGGGDFAFHVRGGDMSMSSISTSIIHYIVQPKLFPYVYFTIGGSFHFIKTKNFYLDGTFEGQTMAVITYFSPDETVVKLGIQEGFGLEKKINNLISVFTEIQYNYLFSNSLTHEHIWDDDYDPDLKLSYLTLLAGIRLSFQYRSASNLKITVEGE